MGRLFLFGTSLHGSSRRDLEDWHARREELIARLQSDQDRGALQGAVVLSTCHRFEVLLDGPRDTDDVLRWLPATSVYREAAAVRHLLRIGTGLESFLIGEEQILCQVRRAFAEAESHGLDSRMLRRVGHGILESARAIRRRTGLGRNTPSLACVGARLLTEAGPRIGVVGAGTMARLALDELVRLGVEDVTVFNRTLPRAREIATPHGYRAEPLERFAATTPRLDGALLAAASPEPLLDGSRVGSLRRIVDLCMPTVVAPELHTAVDCGRVLDVAAIGRHAASVDGQGNPGLATDLVRRHSRRLYEDLHRKGDHLGAVIERHVAAAREDLDGALAGPLSHLSESDRRQLRKFVERRARHHAHLHLLDLKEQPSRETGTRERELAT